MSRQRIFLRHLLARFYVHLVLIAVVVQPVVAVFVFAAAVCVVFAHFHRQLYAVPFPLVVWKAHKQNKSQRWVARARPGVRLWLFMNLSAFGIIPTAAPLKILNNFFDRDSADSSCKARFSSTNSRLMEGVVQVDGDLSRQNVFGVFGQSDVDDFRVVLDLLALQALRNRTSPLTPQEIQCWSSREWNPSRHFQSLKSKLDAIIFPSTTSRLIKSCGSARLA